MLGRQTILLDPREEFTHHRPLQPVCKPRCLRYRCKKKPFNPASCNCITYPSFFLNLPDCPIFKRTDWSKFHACLNNIIPFNMGISNEAGIVTFVGNLIRAIFSAFEVFTPKSRPRADLLFPIPAPIQNEIRLKNSLSCSGNSQATLPSRLK